MRPREIPPEEVGKGAVRAWETDFEGLMPADVPGVDVEIVVPKALLLLSSRGMYSFPNGVMDVFCNRCGTACVTGKNEIDCYRVCIDCMDDDGAPDWRAQLGYAP